MLQAILHLTVTFIPYTFRYLYSISLTTNYLFNEHYIQNSLKNTNYMTLKMLILIIFLLQNAIFSEIYLEND